MNFKNLTVFGLLLWVFGSDAVVAQFPAVLPFGKNRDRVIYEKLDHIAAVISFLSPEDEESGNYTRLQSRGVERNEISRLKPRSEEDLEEISSDNVHSLLEYVVSRYSTNSLGREILRMGMRVSTWVSCKVNERLGFTPFNGELYFHFEEVDGKFLVPNLDKTLNLPSRLGWVLPDSDWVVFSLKDKQGNILFQFDSRPYLQFEEPGEEPLAFQLPYGDEGESFVFTGGKILSIPYSVGSYTGSVTNSLYDLAVVVGRGGVNSQDVTVYNGDGECLPTLVPVAGGVKLTFNPPTIFHELMKVYLRSSSNLNDWTETLVSKPISQTSTGKFGFYTVRYSVTPPDQNSVFGSKKP